MSELEPQLAPQPGPPAGGDPADPELVDERRVVYVDSAGVAAIPDDAGAADITPEEALGRGPSFTSPEKIRALADVMQARLVADRSTTGFFLRSGLKLAQRSGLLNQLPAWSQPDEWDALLALFAGVAVNLMSDELVDTFDLEAAREAGRQVLERVFANQAP